MRCYNCSGYKQTSNNYLCHGMPQCLMRDVERREKHALLSLKINDKIKLKGNKKVWKIIAKNERYLICTNLTQYIICDLYECIYGTIEDISFTKIKKDSDEILKRLEKRIITEQGMPLSQLEISYKNFSTLEIE